MTTFATKEQYLAFRAAWAKAAQAKKLTREHMVLFNLLRDKPAHRGFTPITNKNKLSNGASINGALSDACWALQHIIDYADELLEDRGFISKLKPKKPYEVDRWNWITQRVNKFLDIFEGTLTMEQLIELDVPTITRIEPTFGKGMKMAKAIIAGELQPKTMDDLEGWDGE